VEQDDKGWDARKRAYCLKIQPATGSFARNLIYSTKPRGGHEHIVIPNRLERQFAVTALAHRDWTRFVEIEIGLYSNRFEVISPGALNNSRSVEKMVAGQRSPRNTIIMEVLRDYGYVDFRGMGVRTKIIPLTQAMSGQLPDFTATDDYLKTILYRSPSS
ncbi:ATP-binding protein, partial [Enterobacter hormaechei]|uniref:ATP-binding protein n=1 Tax=Enterobacter hormaechei TaxID=158836 RepID=UPI003D6DC2C7